VINALRHGASVEEIMEVLEITATLGIHTCTVGVPILLEELAASGQGAPADAEPTAREAELRARFIEFHGEWSDAWEGILKLDPDFFEAYVGLAEVPWREGVLEPKVRELIHIAIDSATTHLHTPALRAHIRSAIGYGASAAEIMEVFELTAVLGIHTCTIGVPVLLEEAGTST
jgi:alkylhydroperoxidase/carboxymuconolactone decarboxylase family protein YurZ